ncbi:uncharacterized protein L3040_002735 [Drepanopeziza brunnea f. sp. 'multigermtubi']|uniref:uncharacterized protein n=1 Tax=Drepanopeziza brunnea f. sp. 'multigermtubi' TaxID=698441 RepID=UPI0023902B1D|nr:hypothetical protein L3040_002735 [Drepanopeziza brunnea f. sp. 'multigermtubi']
MPLTPTPKANKILDLVDSRERRRQADLLTRPFDHPHRTPRHILRDFVRLVLPILFLALFLILATVVCIYTFVNRKTLPWSFVKGLGIAFAVVSAGWCIGKTYLYFLDKRRQDTAIHEFLAGERRKEDPGSELLDFMTPREVVCPLRFRRILPRAKRWVAWVWTKRPSGMKPKPVFSPERRIQRHDEYEERLREVWPGTWLRLAAERSARQVEHRRKTQQRNTVRWAPSSTREWSVSDEASIAARSSRSDQAKRRGISAALAPQMPSRLPKARTRKRGRKFEAGLSPIQECRQDSLGPISLEPRTLATPYDISGKPEYRLGTRLVLFSSPALHEKPTARGVNGLGISEQHSIFLDAPIGPEQNVAEARLPNADARKPIIPPPRSSSLRRKEVKVESTTSPSCSTRKCPLSFRFKDAYAAPARPDSPRPLRGSPPPLEISQETKPQPGLPSPATTLDDDAWYSSTESLLYEDEEEAAQPVAAAATSLRTSTPVLSVAPLSVSKPRRHCSLVRA